MKGGKGLESQEDGRVWEEEARAADTGLRQGRGILTCLRPMSSA